jgi:fatty acid desaturase
VNLEFVPRSGIKDREWDEKAQLWRRPDIRRETLKQLNQRSNLNGMVRLIVHTLCIAAAGWVTVFVSRYSIPLAIVPFLIYSFLAGFLNGIEHELRHKIVFSRRWDGFSDAVFFLIHLFLKDGSWYQRSSHVIHHRYTMVLGVDPETNFPEVITSRWVRKELLRIVFNVLALGIPSFLKGLWTLFQRIRGKIDPLVLARCSAENKKKIQVESLAILLINLAGLTVLIILQQWHLIFLLMLGPRVGLAIVSFYFLTEHIGMMYNSNDQRMCTRGVKVSPVVKFFYGGLDEHVEHHLFPAVPSRNLTRLRESIDWKIPERYNVIQCWREIMEIARHKEKHPEDEILPPY